MSSFDSLENILGKIKIGLDMSLTNVTSVARLKACAAAFPAS